MTILPLLQAGAEVAPAAALETLAGMDAIVIDDEGVGCYPFSARAMGIRVDFAGRSVHAMCAVDALAIPHLVRHLGRVAARCVICHCHLACEITGHGELAQGAAQGLRVFWRRAAAGHGPCCCSLCSGIGFVCQHCTIGEEGLSLALPQALSVGNAFFSLPAPATGALRAALTGREPLRCHANNSRH